jgi:hypothetical protein
MYAAQYRQVQPSSSGTSSSGIPRTTSGALPSIPQGRTANPTYEQEDDQASTGWENISLRPVNRHPTRLSDIIEEQTARTSPSRTSYVSGSGVLPGGESFYPSSSAPGSARR